jgi:hypothetical protein
MMIDLPSNPSLNDEVVIGNKTYKWDGVAWNADTLSLSKVDVGLANVDNTSDLGKPVYTAQQVALEELQQEIDGLKAITEW